MGHTTSIQEKVNPVYSYFIAGKLLHFIALLEIMAAIIIVPLLIGWDTGEGHFLWVLKHYALAFLISLPFFSQLDARSRYQNYKQIKDQLYFYGYDERIFKPILKSRCQRDAAWLSAKELGYGNQCLNYFRTCGYRWYHILPDFVFKRPQFLFTKYFWRTTFFTPRYIPKVDYGTLTVLHNTYMTSPDAHVPAT